MTGPTLLRAVVVGSHGAFARGARGRRTRTCGGGPALVIAARATLAQRGGSAVRLGDTGALALFALHTLLGDVHRADALDPTGTFLVVVIAAASATADREYWRTAEPDGGAFASPASFPATLASAVAGEITIAFDLRGPSLVFVGDCGPALRVARGIAATPPRGVTSVVLISVKGSAESIGATGDLRAALRARAIVWRARSEGGGDDV